MDFIKNDCVFGGQWGPETLAQIEAQSKSIEKFADVRPIVYSLSPGGNPNRTAQAKSVARFANMYRVTGDTWDHWSMLEDHFDTAAELADAGVIGAEGPGGSKSFPDLDMLPLGYVTKAGDDHRIPDHWTSLTKDEQTTLMTLWAMARSPLIYGGDARLLGSEDGQFTLKLLTNPEMLRVSAESSNNHQVRVVEGERVWAAQGRQHETIAAFFNTGDEDKTMTASLSLLGVDGRFPGVSVRDLWAQQALDDVTDEISVEVPSHGARLLSLTELSSASAVVL